MADDIRYAFGSEFDGSIFVPYVQMHELEALILASPQRLADEFPERRQEVGQLAMSIEGLDPEAIDDGATTAPSKRIITHVPEYEKRKSSAAPNVLRMIGVDTLRQTCRHFGEWVGRLEQLGVAPA